MPHFTTHDGARLHYQDWGSGTPILFLAGAWLSSASWELQMLPLSQQGSRCLAYDRRGHGKSDWTGTGYDIDSLADDLGAFLDHVDLRDVTVVAHSMSGGELLKYIGRHGSDRIARVVLVGSTLPFMAQSEDNPAGIPRMVFDMMRARRAADRPLWMEQNTQAFFATHLGTDVSSARIDWTVQQCLDCSLLASDAVVETMFETDFRDDVRALDLPTLVVHGDADASAPVDLCARAVRELLPSCEYREYHAAGHGLLITHAEQLNSDIVSFIAGDRDVSEQ